MIQETVRLQEIYFLHIDPLFSDQLQIHVNLLIPHLLGRAIASENLILIDFSHFQDTLNSITSEENIHLPTTLSSYRYRSFSRSNSRNRQFFGKYNSLN